MYQSPGSEESRRDLAMAHVRLGHIHRLIAKPDDAEREYRTRSTGSRGSSPTTRSPNIARPSAVRTTGSAKCCAARRPSAPTLRSRHTTKRSRSSSRLPENPAFPRNYREELARTLYNRGILLSGSADGAERAQNDFRQAIAILEPLSTAEPAGGAGTRAGVQQPGQPAVCRPGARGRRAGAVGEGDRHRRAIAGGRSGEPRVQVRTRDVSRAISRRCSRSGGQHRGAEQRSAQADRLMEELSRRRTVDRDRSRGCAQPARHHPGWVQCRGG